MTVPCITYAQLRDEYLIPNGYAVETPQPQDFWNGHNRIIIKKGDYSFPLQFQERYFYLQIVRLFRQLEIPVPEDHQKSYDQHMALHEKKLSQNKETQKDNEGDK